MSRRREHQPQSPTLVTEADSSSHQEEVLWREAYGIVDRAKAVHGDQRDQIVDGACQDRPGLRKVVDRLMSCVESSASWSEGAGLDTEEGREVGEGTRIDGHEIREMLGRGGMGVVYRAVQVYPRREVALKIMRPDWTDDGWVRRFEREVSVLADLRHPFISAIHLAGRWTSPSGASLPYYLMELVEDARSLTRYCREEGLEPTERIQIFLSVLEAIEHGHSRGVIHRDIKPENILVDADGRPRVIDFGLAKIASAEDSGAPLSAPMGTVAYMAPEQFAGSEATTRSDVFALGLVLHELLLERALPRTLPFQNGKTASAVSRAERPLLAGLSGILDQATDPDPASRFPSAGALADAIRAEWDEGSRWHSSRPGRATLFPWIAAATSLAIAVIALISPWSAGRDAHSESGSSRSIGLAIGPEDVAHHWSFDGSWKDLCSEAEAVPLGSVAFVSTGYRAGSHAIDFRGGIDAVDLTCAVPALQSDAWSVALWMNIRSLGPTSDYPRVLTTEDRLGQGIILSLRHDRGKRTRTIQISVGQTGRQGRELSVRPRIDASTSATNWQHIVLCHYRGSTTVYVDGNPASPALVTREPLIDRGRHLLIGNVKQRYRPTVRKRPFDGLIDEITVFRRPLSPFEIAELVRDPALVSDLISKSDS